MAIQETGVGYLSTVCKINKTANSDMSTKFNCPTEKGIINILNSECRNDKVCKEKASTLPLLLRVYSEKIRAPSFSFFLSRICIVRARKPQNVEAVSGSWRGAATPSKNNRQIEAPMPTIMIKTA